jgi:predicted HTH transcriptional regulator
MSTSVAQIDQWRGCLTEHQNLEFKEAKTQFDNRRLYEYCVALANEGGGHLVLGVSNSPPRTVVGSSAFNDLTAIASKVFDVLGFRVEFEEVLHPDGRVVVVSVPPRPRGTAYHLDGRYLMRSGEALVPMSEDRLRMIFSEGAPNWLEERATPPLDPQQVIEMLDTSGFFALLKLPYPPEQSGVIARLVGERLIDAVDGGYAIRRLGALLLAQRLDAFPEVARKSARVIVYNDISKINTKLEQIGAKGYAVGFRGMIRFIMSQLPQNEVVEDALRKEVKLVPEIAVRELVANALVHQDLAMSGTSVMIDVYSNRIEISNPGDPIVPVERFIDGYQSRNERMADLMRRFGICEEKSSGVDKVVAIAEAYQLPAPNFVVGHRRTSVIISGPKSFEQMDRDERVRAAYQHCALKWVMGERMTNQSLRERFRVPENRMASVSQVISASIDADLIKADDKAGTSRRYARYLPFWA